MDEKLKSEIITSIRLYIQSVDNLMQKRYGGRPASMAYARPLMVRIGAVIKAAEDELTNHYLKKYGYERRKSKRVGGVR
jgi:hypothetical protein